MFGEFENVRLSPEQHLKLLTRFGASTTKDYIERASRWLTNTRKRRPNHYAMILTWIRKDSTIEAHTEAARPKEPLLEEAELRHRAEIMVTIRARDLATWERLRGTHSHDQTCKYGACCMFDESKRPRVPTLGELIQKLRENP